MNAMPIPAAILVFLHKEADNEYTTFETLSAAANRIAEYRKDNKDMERLEVFIDHDLPQKEKDQFWDKVRAYGVDSVYRINPAVLYNAI